jgi:hypothetical protein
LKEKKKQDKRMFVADGQCVQVNTENIEDLSIDDGFSYDKEFIIEPVETLAPNTHNQKCSE